MKQYVQKPERLDPKHEDIAGDLHQFAVDIADAAGKSFDSGVKEIVKTAAEKTRDLAQKYAPKKTGKGADSIDYKITDQGFGAEIAPNLRKYEYMYFQEVGTKGPYTIRPKNAKALRFETNDGKVVYAKHVTHPGIKAKRYMQRTADEIGDAIEKVLGDQLQIFMINDPRMGRKAGRQKYQPQKGKKAVNA